MGEAPGEVVELAERRAEARRQRDFAQADRLRDEIHAAGWQVLDRPEGFDLEPRPSHPSVAVVADLHSWPDDGKRFVASLPEGGFEIVEAVAAGGFASERNTALARAGAEIVVFVDTSLEVIGDLLGTLVSALDDPTVAVAGPYGLVSADLRDYEERTAGDVVAIQGYCLAARREDLQAVGGFRESFAFYRNADIDVSLRLRTAGGELRRAVAVGAEHSRRHLHRAWEATPPEDRDRLSRRNMRRILDRFGDRVSELVVA